MRSREEVSEKFFELRARMLGVRKSKLLSRRFVNCQHNVRIPVKGVGKVGMCQNSVLLKKRDRPLVCNDDNYSGRCESFGCSNTEETVEREFKEILASPSRCGEEYPKLAMLIWFLQDDSPSMSRLARLRGHVGKGLSELFKVVTFRWLT